MLSGHSFNAARIVSRIITTNNEKVFSEHKIYMNEDDNLRDKVHSNLI